MVLLVTVFFKLYNNPNYAIALPVLYTHISKAAWLARELRVGSSQPEAVVCHHPWRILHRERFVAQSCALLENILASQISHP